VSSAFATSDRFDFDPPDVETSRLPWRPSGGGAVAGEVLLEGSAGDVRDLGAFLPGLGFGAVAQVGR